MWRGADKLGGFSRHENVLTNGQEDGVWQGLLEGWNGGQTFDGGAAGCGEAQDAGGVVDPPRNGAAGVEQTAIHSLPILAPADWRCGIPASRHALKPDLLDLVDGLVPSKDAQSAALWQNHRFSFMTQ